MDKLSRIEQEYQISLPEIYKDFYKLCSFSIPEKLIGTDLRNTHPELNRWAIELLEEDGIENFLDDSDFVCIEKRCNWFVQVLKFHLTKKSTKLSL